MYIVYGPRTDQLEIESVTSDSKTSGFRGLSMRHGKKPIITAVNGLAVGGGTEMVIGCDLVVASLQATPYLM
jgi:enoyl-CoA hydratase/carnithine racemase